MGLALLRLAIVAGFACAGLAASPALAPPGHRWWMAAAGAGVGLLVVLLERPARGVAGDRLVLGAAGGTAGLVAGLALGTAIDALIPGLGGAARGAVGLAVGYLGLTAALARREVLVGVAARFVSASPAEDRGDAAAILDTSAIIDGRIALVCEAGFLTGPLVVPQFVLRELQQIADSPDVVRRNRGKRGFEVLRRLQGLPGAPVRLDDRDVPGVREVDRKLVELAKLVGGRVVTNDGNLSKIAELSGVAVLNVNELAGALRPVALPGESLRLHVLREGKEAGQGVAYLDDGTMVVVDHGRKLIGQTVDATVTSVLQTPAGRMIFARPLPAAAAPGAPPATAGSPQEPPGAPQAAGSVPAPPGSPPAPASSPLASPGSPPASIQERVAR